MIKRFNEFIEEGFMTRSLNRSKSDSTKRLQNKTPIDDYIKTIEWVDLGHDDLLFAKLDYGYDKFHDYELLSIEDINKIMSNLPSDVSVMNNENFSWLKENCVFLSENEIKVTSGINNYTTCIRFNHSPSWYYMRQGGGYLLDILGDVAAGVSVRELKMMSKGKVTQLVRNNVIDEDNFSKPIYTIKLVKKK